MKSHSRVRLQVAAFSGLLSLVYAAGCAAWPGSDGRTAVGLNLLNLAFFLIYAWHFGDTPCQRLLLSAGAFGVVELLADFLCVRYTGTLDYSVARSALILASPWWMPLSWAVVAVQMGVAGEALIRRYGLLRGAALGGLVGAGFIPFYEEMAWGAHWWRYQRCLLLSHTPVYIILAEAIIGCGLALWGFATLRTTTRLEAIHWGIAAGLMTLLGGVLAWGTVEFLGRGLRPWD